MRFVWAARLSPQAHRAIGEDAAWGSAVPAKLASILIVRSL